MSFIISQQIFLKQKNKIEKIVVKFKIIDFFPQYVYKHIAQ